MDLEKLKKQVRGVKIQSDVPLPERISKRINIGPLPLLEMNPGDSFVLTAKNEDEQEKMLHSLRVRLSRFTQSNPDFKFSSTKEGKGIRVWRV